MFNADAGPDPTSHPVADPDPDPSFHIKTQTLKKMLKYRVRLIFHTFWIVIYKLMRMRIRFRIPYSYHFDADPDADPDPDFYLMRLQMRIHNTNMW